MRKHPVFVERALPDMKREWDEIFKAMDKKNLKLSESEIQNEVAKARKSLR